MNYGDFYSLWMHDIHRLSICGFLYMYNIHMRCHFYGNAVRSIDITVKNVVDNISEAFI